MKLEDKRSVVELLLCAANSIVSGTVQHYTPLGCAALGLGLDWRNPCDVDSVSELAMQLTAKANYGKAWGCSSDTAGLALEAAYRLIESSPTLIREFFHRGAP